MRVSGAVPVVDSKCVRTESPLVGRTICVLFGTDERLRKRLMEILKRYGANVVANPGKRWISVDSFWLLHVLSSVSVEDMSLVVATTDKHLKTRAQVEAGKVTVLRSKWVLRCEQEGEVVPW